MQKSNTTTSSIRSYIAAITCTAYLCSTATTAVACDKPVTLLLQGQASPCQGYLFSPEQELKVRLLDADSTFLQKKVDLLGQENESLKAIAKVSDEIAAKEAEKAELWRNKAEDSTKKFMEEEEGRGRRDWLFLVSGIALTLAASWAVHNASNK